MRIFVTAAAVTALAAAGVTAAALASGDTRQATTVKVTAGESGSKMFFKLSRKSAPAGSVKFTIKNGGVLVHEFAVIDKVKAGPVTTAKGKAKYIKKARLKEVESIQPGSTASLSLKLTKGVYLLLCNKVGHYQSGMWTTFTVT